MHADDNSVPAPHDLRRMLGDRPVVGITGSYGKTSTVRILEHCLKPRMNVVSNRASYNMLDSVIASLRRAADGDAVVIQELGAHGPRTLEGSLLALLPTVGLITAIRDDHLKAFRSREAVLAEKFKLVQSLPADGVALLNLDDPLLAGCVPRVHCRLRTFGLSESADFHAFDVDASWPEHLGFRLRAGDREFTVQTGLFGAHSLLSVLAALAIADTLGADLGECVSSLATLKAPPGRMEQRRLDGGPPVIVDWIKAARYMLDDSLAFLAGARAARRILVVGQLSDSPGSKGRLFRRLATACRERGILLVILVADSRQYLRRRDFGLEDGVLLLDSILDLPGFLRKQDPGNCVVLLKAATSSHFERLFLAGETTVRCAAIACGRRGSCERCPELARDHARDYRYHAEGIG